MGCTKMSSIKRNMDRFHKLYRVPNIRLEVKTFHFFVFKIMKKIFILNIFLRLFAGWWRWWRSTNAIRNIFKIFEKRNFKKLKTSKTGFGYKKSFYDRFQKLKWGLSRGIKVVLVMKNVPLKNVIFCQPKVERRILYLAQEGDGRDPLTEIYYHHSSTIIVHLLDVPVGTNVIELVLICDVC